MNLLKLTLSSLILLVGIANAQNIVRENAVVICDIQGEMIRLDYFKKTSSGLQNFIVARGLDAEGNTKGNCEYLGQKEYDGMMQFIPNIKADKGFYYCPGPQHSQYKIGILSIDTALFAKDTPKGTSGRILINLADRKIPGREGHYLSTRDTCTRY